MADFTTRDKVALLKDFLNVVGTETEGVEVKVTRDADNGMRFYSDPEVVIEVKNATLAQLDAGTPVYVSGTAASGKPEVSPAQANSATTMPAIGLIQDDIASGDEGFVVAGGLVVGLDTDTPAWDDGTALYVSPTVAGGLTDTRPTGTTELVQKVALVTRRHATVGSVIVMGAGRTNDIPNDLVTLTGVPRGDSDLGTFTGTTIADNETIKGALQDLETAVEAGGGGGVKYHGRYDTEAETARSGASTTTEIYYTARPDGDGYAENEVTTSTPAGAVIERKLYYSDKFDADPDTSGDWTAYTTQPADDTAFATAKASLLAGLSDTDGTANTRGTLPVSLKMEHRFAIDLLLDDYPNASAAYSVRKLRTAYTGSALRVREASGNTETDIGFDSNGDLDTAAIASHCGSANGYVATWYDQSGNGNNATQATTTNQPQIYNGSAVITQNGKPCLYFPTTQHMTASGAATVGSRSRSQWSVFSLEAGTDYAMPWAYGLRSQIQPPDTNLKPNLFVQRTGGQPSITAASGINLNQQYLRCDIADTVTAESFIDGSSVLSGSDNNSDWSTSDLGIGFSSGDRGPFKVTESILYESDQSSNRTGITSNINTYYSIY